MISVKKMTCRALIVSMLALSFQTAQAGLIGAEQAAPTQVSTERGMVLAALDRAEVASQLRAAGVDPQDARDRVAAMSDQEVRTMMQDIQNGPAGALDTGGWIAVLVLAGVLWYFLVRK